MAILYMQFISTIMLKQQGFVTKMETLNPTFNFVKDFQVPAELKLKDVKE